jgi:hypothetical protein
MTRVRWSGLKGSGEISEKGSCVWANESIASARVELASLMSVGRAGVCAKVFRQKEAPIADKHKQRQTAFSKGALLMKERLFIKWHAANEFRHSRESPCGRETGRRDAPKCITNCRFVKMILYAQARGKISIACQSPLCYNASPRSFLKARAFLSGA